MTIKLGTVSSLPDSADLKRQAEWRERSVKKIKDSRQWRLNELNKERVAIKRAVEAYSILDHGDVPTIVLRSRFIRLRVARQLITTEESDAEEPRELSSAAEARRRRRELSTRPPLTRLVHRQSNALSLYLTAVYMAHLEVKPGQAFENRQRNIRGTEEAGRSWCLLAGLSGPREIRSRRARMRRALDELVAAGLINIQPPGARHRYEGWLLLNDDGSESAYRVPGERDAGAVHLPATFFLRGWHLVLTPSEIAMLLVIMHMARRVGRPTEPGGQPWVALPRTVRRSFYGVSGEVYLHAQQLHEFGLIDFHDPMPTRRRGKISAEPTSPPQPTDGHDAPAVQTRPQPLEPEPYQFSPANPTVFDQDAFTVVQRTLSTLSLPYRLDENGLLISPQNLVAAYLQAEQSRGSR